MMIKYVKLESRCPSGVSLSAWKEQLQFHSIYGHKCNSSGLLIGISWKTRDHICEHLPRDLADICLEFVVPSVIEQSTTVGFHEGARFMWGQNPRILSNNEPLYVYQQYRRYGFRQLTHYWCKFGFLDLLITQKFFSEHIYVNLQIKGFHTACVNHQKKLAKFMLLFFKKRFQTKKYDDDDVVIDMYINQLFESVCHAKDMWAVDAFLDVFGNEFSNWDVAWGVGLLTENSSLKKRALCQDTKRDWNYVLLKAAEANEMGDIKNAIENGATDFFSAHRNTRDGPIRDLLDEKMNAASRDLWDACRKNDLERVTRCALPYKHAGKGHPNQALGMAKRFYDLRIINFLKQKGAKIKSYRHETYQVKKTC